MKTLMERKLNTLTETYCNDMFSLVRPNSISAGNSEQSFIWHRFNNNKQITERLRC